MNLNNPTLNKVFAKSVSVRGTGNEYHKIVGIFRSKVLANEAVTTGAVEIVSGVINLALVGGQGMMFWSEDLGTFITAADWTEFAQSADSYIAFDGDNDYISFSTANEQAAKVCTWDNSWSIGMTFVDFSDMTDNKRMSIFSNGGNHITLQRGGGQDALYITGNNGATSHGANIWYNMADNRRIVFTYDSVTRKLGYYVGNGNGGYNRRALLSVDGGSGVGGAGGTPDGVFSIGKGNGGTIVNFHGAADKIITRDAVMSDVQLVDYFSNIDRDYTTLPFYGDLTSYINCGEDAHPLVVDTKGAFTDGEFFGGSASSYKLTPTE